MLRLTNLNCQKVSLINKVYDLELTLCIPLLFASHLLITGFAKLHVGLVVLVKRMSVLINFLLQNTKQFLVMSDRTDTFRELCNNSVFS